MSTSKELERLRDLYESGAINDDEYELAKAKALRETRAEPREERAERDYRDSYDDEREDRRRPRYEEDDYDDDYDDYEERSPRRDRRRRRRRRRGSFDPDKDANQFAVLLHLSTFAGFIAPGLGLVLPIVLWQMKKEEMPEIDEHGKHVANWLISSVIYFAISIVLIFVVIGIPLVIVLLVLSIIFPIIGAVKANNGEVWRYPLSIQFFS